MRATFLLFFLFACGFAFPQITITHADYVDAWQVGSAHVNYATPMAGRLSVFVGIKSDAPQTWDFTGYTINQVGTSTGVEPSSAPLIDQFPNANAVLYTKSYPFGDTIFAWQYQRIDSDRLLLYGVSDETSVSMTYDPPVIQAMIPLDYGMTWVTQRDSTSIVPPYYAIVETTASVDAFGTLQIPAGNFQCLRLTLERVGITYTPIGNDTTRSRSYHFYTRNMVELNILGVTEAQFNESTIDVSGFNYSVPDNSGAIAENDFKTCHLYPNSPNPFQNTTKIIYRVSTPDMVTIRILDCLGNEISTLLKEHRNAGQHEITFNAAGLAEGVYICQLTSGKTTQNIKMVLTK
jgi:hypothetical protein